MGLYRKLRRGKRDRLLSDGFTRHEANEISPLPFSKMPYIRTMRRHRRRILEGVRTRKEVLARIRQDYDANGWRDVFSMMRDFRQKAIDRGYKPIMWVQTAKYHQAHKGQKKAQGARARERERRRKEARKRGAVSAMYDSEGKLIGEVYQDKSTGRFEVR